MQGREIWFTQAKVIGGGRSINAQVYTRGHRHDYDAWAQDWGCNGWSYCEVLPYFKRAEGNERFGELNQGTGGPLGVSMLRGAFPICDAFIRAGQEYGLPYNPDFNGAQQAGVGYYQLTQKSVRRSSTASAYLKTAEQRPSLTVMTHTQAPRVVVTKGPAVGVEVLRQGQRSVIKARKEVLIASGAIGSPRLLMLSGIGRADDLRSVDVDVVNDLSGVGRNLQDHIDLCAMRECTGRQSYDGVERLDRGILAGQRYMLFKTGPVTASLFETDAFG